MGFFKNNFEQVVNDESVLVKRAENEVSILKASLEKRKWVKIWDSLCHSELSKAPITEQMSEDVRENFRNLAIEIKKVLLTEKKGMEQGLAEDIDLYLDKVL